MLCSCYVWRMKIRKRIEQGSHYSLLFFPSPNLYKAATFASMFTSTHPSNPHTSPSRSNKRASLLKEYTGIKRSHFPQTKTTNKPTSLFSSFKWANKSEGKREAHHCWFEILINGEGRVSWRGVDAVVFLGLWCHSLCHLRPQSHCDWWKEENFDLWLHSLPKKHSSSTHSTPNFHLGCIKICFFNRFLHLFHFHFSIFHSPMHLKSCSSLQMWPDLIQKAKDGGLDVIQTYVFWNGHEPSPGKVMQIHFLNLLFLHGFFLFRIP